MVDTEQLQESLAQDLCAGDGVQGTWRGAQAAHQAVNTAGAIPSQLCLM